MYIILSPYPFSFHLNISVSEWGRDLYVGSDGGGAIAAGCGCLFEYYYYGHVDQSCGRCLKRFIYTLLMPLVTDTDSSHKYSQASIMLYSLWKSAGGILCEVDHSFGWCSEADN